MRIAAFGAALTVLLAPCVAYAEGQRAPGLPLELTWDAPPTCPGEDDVTRRVRHLLSEAPAEQTTVTAVARIRPIGDRFELVLTTEVADARGTKTATASSCTTLVEAAAVFLALAIDSAKEVPRPIEATTTATTTPRAAAPSSDIPAARPAEPRAARERLRFGGGAWGLLDLGTLPDPAVGLAVHVEVRLGRIRGGILGTLWHTQQPTFDVTRGAGAKFDMRSAGLFGCYLFPIGWLHLGGCANVEATAVEVLGVGIRNPQAQRSFWPTIVTGILGEARLTSWLCLVARVDLLSAIAAPDVALATSNGNVKLYEPGIFSARAGLGAEIVLP